LNAEQLPRLHALHLLMCQLHVGSLSDFLMSSTVQLVQLSLDDSQFQGDYEDFAGSLSEFALSVRYYEYFAACEGEPDLEWPLSIY
jgi:hypothetical protein